MHGSAKRNKLYKVHYLDNGYTCFTNARALPTESTTSNSEKSVSRASSLTPSFSSSVAAKSIPASWASSTSRSTVSEMSASPNAFLIFFRSLAIDDGETSSTKWRAQRSIECSMHLCILLLCIRKELND